MSMIGSRPKFAIFMGLVASVILSLDVSKGIAAEQFPRVERAVAIELQNDWNYQSEDLDNEHNQLFIKIEPEATLHVAPGLSLFAHGVVEPVRDPGPGEDRAFEDEGFYFEDLFLRYEAGGFALQGGKFTVAFGLGWDAAPGLYGSEFAEAGYQFTERIGLIGSAELVEGKDTGAHVLSAHGFFLDTTVLAQSVGTGRGTTGKSDGGVSNTEDFSSYAITLDGENVAAINGLGYRLAYIRQAPGQGNETEETGVSIGLTYTVEFGNGLSLSPFIEYVRFNDAEGVTGQDREFLTLAGRADWKNWNLSVSYTERDTESSSGVETDDFQFQASVGYQFDFGLEFNLGWFIANESGIETRRVGAQLVYGFDF